MSERKGQGGKDGGGLLDMSSALSAALAEAEALAAEQDRERQRQVVQEALAERDSAGAAAAQPEVRGMTIEQVAELRGVTVAELSKARPASGTAASAPSPGAAVAAAPAGAQSRPVGAPRPELAAHSSQLADVRQRADKLEAQLAEVRADLAANRRRFQRLVERNDEAQTRIQRQEVELPRRISQTVIGALLPALDMADAVATQLITGGHLDEDERSALTMLAAEWQRTFQMLGIQAFEAVGQTFDPTIHEAISEEHRADVEPGRVLRQVGRGYLLEGRLLRSAQVVVCAAEDPAVDPAG